MQTLTDGKLVLSATDLTNHLACPHLTQQRLGITRGERPAARKSESAHQDLLSRRGDEHERDQLARLEAELGTKAVDLDRGRSQWSQEEADAIAATCRALLDGGMVTEPLRDAPDAVTRALAAGHAVTAGVTHDDGMITRPLTPRDILIVAPYNLAVQPIASAVPSGVRVGTVDKLQGQEAPVVFYALTCSTAEDVPRGLDFLFDANRLNVAISRAQCLAVLVHSPRLLDVDARTLEAMRLVDGVCRLEGLAGSVREAVVA